jgi:Predicted nucleic-acid-binding protein containing a Zn-ribbon
VTLSAEAEALTGEFWAAAARHELVRPVCRDCGRNFFTPQIACPQCLSENWSYERSSGRGRVYSATVVHKAATPDVPVPFRLGIVDLDEGWSMLTTFVDGPGGRLPAIGAPVEVTWVEQDGRTVPAFREIVP